MNATIINLIIQLVSGAVGGNIACGLMKSLSLGPVGNSIAGIVGGGLGDRSEHADAGRRAGAGAAVVSTSALSWHRSQGSGSEEGW